MLYRKIDTTWAILIHLAAGGLNNRDPVLAFLKPDGNSRGAHRNLLYNIQRVCLPRQYTVLFGAADKIFYKISVHFPSFLSCTL